MFVWRILEPLLVVAVAIIGITQIVFPAFSRSLPFFWAFRPKAKKRRRAVEELRLALRSAQLAEERVRKAKSGAMRDLDEAERAHRRALSQVEQKKTELSELG